MELYFVLTILDRAKARVMSGLHREAEVPFELPFQIELLGRGTAQRSQLDFYGLEATEKTALICTADAAKTRSLFKAARQRLFIDIPGNGIMMSIPVKSVGGGQTLRYLTNGETPDKGAPQMNFTHELIIVVLNQGYTDEVMNAARAAGAGGGTVLHAKGTGAEYARKFLGVSLASEKECILIVSETGNRSAIMEAITREAGPSTPAGAITFSLPDSSVAGLRSRDNTE